MALSRWFSRRSAIAQKIKGNPYYRFQSPEEIEIGGKMGVKIDVNTASMDDWLRLPGISIHQARKLVEITKSGIHLLCLEDLASVLGVSVLKIQFWQPILYFAYYSKDSFYFPAQININQANVEKLCTIPNLDNETARKIIEERDSNGQYNHIADLQKRVNLNGDLTYHLMKYLEFS